MKKSLFVILAVLSLVACEKVKSPKYVFYFIGDGMGVNQVLGTQMFLAQKEGRIGAADLSFTNFDERTMISTFSRYNSVTCSAAAGTALASGEKTRNGAIGMDSLLQKPLFSVAQRAKAAGKRVGICTSVSLDHATPAAFYAHQPSRTMGYEIALDIAASGFDFFAGSGFSQLKKEGKTDVLTALKTAGYEVARGLGNFQEKKTCEKLILIQNDSLENLPFAIDRTAADLSLAEITRSAIEFLGKSGDGFFVMIEGGLIDWACHSNDAATAFAEVEDFSRAISLALEFYEKHKDETLILVTADHETGGLVLGRGEYRLDLAVLAGQKKSLFALTKELEKTELADWAACKEFLKARLGFWETCEISATEESDLREIFEKRKKGENLKIKTLYAENEKLAQTAVAILNQKAQISWASGGHSAGFVPLYAIGVGAEEFGKVRDNTEIVSKIILK